MALWHGSRWPATMATSHRHDHGHLSQAIVVHVYGVVQRHPVVTSVVSDAAAKP